MENRLDESTAYWDQAGRQGYSEAMYRNRTVAEHVVGSTGNLCLKASREVGLTAAASILELGCGDGRFALTCLAPNFRSVDGYDLSQPAIERARAQAVANTVFECADLSDLRFLAGRTWDGAFLVGFLHHVKSATPLIVSQLLQLTPKVIVMEPNGNHLGRKLLEKLPSYKAAGEDSFKRRELEEIFTAAGYRKVFYQRYNLFPNQAPQFLFGLMRRLERVIESSELLSRLCTAQVYAFTRPM